MRFGKRGTKGQTRTKEVDDAQEAADEVINEKLASGYVEVDVEQFEFASDSVQLRKAWGGLHFLFTGTAHEGEPPLDFLYAGGAKIEAMDFGYGPARVFDGADVKIICAALEAFTPESLRAAYRPEVMKALNVYPADWVAGGEAAFEWLRDSFEALRVALKTAASNDCGMLISVS